MCGARDEPGSPPGDSQFQRFTTSVYQSSVNTVNTVNTINKHLNIRELHGRHWDEQTIASHTDGSPVILLSLFAKTTLYVCSFFPCGLRVST
jgi:hypothetical protein